MSEERRQPQPRPRPEIEFGLTEQEQMYDRVSHDRLVEFLSDEATTVHRIEDSYNNYGEFTFVTLSRPGQDRRVLVTFWGAGYHEYRERWLTDEWRWHISHPFPDLLEKEIDREVAKTQIEERLAAIRLHTGQAEQSERGRLFDALADLIDEDGAYTEMQDLDDMFE